MNQFKCPKCPGYMQTYNRAGVHIEQCNQCHGIFLDSGELEAISSVEARFTQHHAAPPPPPGYHQQPGWGQHGYYGHHGRKKGFASMLFSS